MPGTGEMLRHALFYHHIPLEGSCCYLLHCTDEDHAFKGVAQGLQLENGGAIPPLCTIS